MTDYKTIKGFNIRYLAQDPVLYAGSWSAGGTMNTGRYSLAGAGIQTAGLAFGGIDSVNLNATEEYDGSTWTTSPGTLNTARRDLAGAGTQTAGLAFGGTSAPGLTTSTEEFTGETSALNFKTLTTS